MTTLEWRPIYPNDPEPADFFCEVDGYTLLVEDLHPGYCWFVVYFRDKQIDAYKYTGTKELAFEACEAMYRRHKEGGV